MINIKRVTKYGKYKIFQGNFQEERISQHVSSAVQKVYTQNTIFFVSDTNCEVNSCSTKCFKFL